VTADIPHTYVAYGTVVESTISLSELLSEASDKDRETTAGVSVIEESLPRHPDGLNSEAAEVYTDSSEGLRIFRLDDGFFLVYRGSALFASNRTESLSHRRQLPVEPISDGSSLAWDSD